MKHLVVFARYGSYVELHFPNQVGVVTPFLSSQFMLTDALRLFDLYGIPSDTPFSFISK